MTLAGLAMAVFAAMGGGSVLALGGRVAVIEIDGAIMSDDQFLEDVRRLRDDGSVQGWVVSINSPGGVVAPSQSMFHTLQRIRAEDEVPVVAAIGAVGASGGYYVALGADSILALPGSITGSIGVLMEYPNVSELMGKIGVEMEVVKGGAQKDIGSPFRDMGPEDREILAALVLDVHEQFIEVVAEARGLAVEEVRPLADGRILTGRQAQAAGLVDRLGNVEEAIAVAGRMAGLGSDPRIVRPPSEEVSWLARTLFGSAGAETIRQLARLVPVSGGYPALKYVVH